MYTIIFITAANKKEARLIAEKLIKERLAACVNIIEKVESVFWWQGKVDRANEVLLMVKSTKKNLPKIVKAVRSVHSYKVPEVISLPIGGGFKRYLDWIDESVE